MSERDATPMWQELVNAGYDAHLDNRRQVSVSIAGMTAVLGLSEQGRWDVLTPDGVHRYGLDDAGAFKIIAEYL